MKFFKCNQDKTIFTLMKSGAPSTTCNHAEFEELVPGTTDGAAEKHVPVIKVEGNRVTVLIGEVEHPMTEEHYIEWITLETKKGMQTVYLDPKGGKPHAEFLLTDADEVIAAYEYCNIHGLWKAEC
ncbi:MAG: desulfoferrodoxin [Lachnospiraceae bacterium]|nr:desulfoferrodoxin [Lachnospiraceae bacterium]MBQ5851887.1 desulfoferrodoxin [Lachnospiraceae bacterium]